MKCTSFGQVVLEEQIKMWKANGRQTQSDGKSSRCLWQGELKIFLKNCQFLQKKQQFIGLPWNGGKIMFYLISNILVSCFLSICQSFACLLITIPRFPYHYGSLIRQFLKELLPFLNLCKYNLTGNSSKICILITIWRITYCSCNCNSLKQDLK